MFTVPRLYDQNWLYTVTQTGYITQTGNNWVMIHFGCCIEEKLKNKKSKKEW